MVKRRVCVSVCLSLLGRRERGGEGSPASVLGCKGLTSFPWRDICISYVHKVSGQTLLPRDTHLFRGRLKAVANLKKKEDYKRIVCKPHFLKLGMNFDALICFTL